MRGERGEGERGESNGRGETNWERGEGKGAAKARGVSKGRGERSRGRVAREGERGEHTSADYVGPLELFGILTCLRKKLHLV